MTTKTYSVPDISCGHCVMTIERELKYVDGLQSVKADQDTKAVRVEVESDNVLSQSRPCWSRSAIRRRRRDGVTGVKCRVSGVTDHPET